MIEPKLNIAFDIHILNGNRSKAEKISKKILAHQNGILDHMMYEANAGTHIDVVNSANGKVETIKFTEKALLEHAEDMKTIKKAIEYETEY